MQALFEALEGILGAIASTQMLLLNLRERNVEDLERNVEDLLLFKGSGEFFEGVHS